MLKIKFGTGAVGAGAAKSGVVLVEPEHNFDIVWGAIFGSDQFSQGF
jgi:hypothetical protein